MNFSEISSNVFARRNLILLIFLMNFFLHQLKREESCAGEREKDGDGRHLTFKMNLSGQQPSEMEIIINKEIDIPECIKSPAGKQIFLLLLLCLRFLWILLDEILIEETNLLEELRDQKKKREGLLLRPAFNFFHFKGALDFYDFLKSLFFLLFT